MDSRGVRVFDEVTFGGRAKGVPVLEPASVATGTSDSSHVFSTPQSRGSTQEAGDWDSGDGSKVGLFVVREVALVCGGVVGGNGGRRDGSLKFCTKSADDCKIKTHVTSKADLKADRYYIKWPKGWSTLFEPSLSLGSKHISGEETEGPIES